MDLRALGMDLEKGRAVVALRDAAGDSSTALDGPAFGRVLREAAPLLERLGAAHGPPLRLSLNPLVGSLRVTTAAGEVLLAGDAYAALRPLLREPARLAVREARPPKPDLPDASDEAARWEHKYQVGSDGWELMRPAPPLVRYLAAAPPRPGSRALVPGCGRGHEARLLAQRGVRVTALDFSPSAVRECQRLAEEEGLADLVHTELADLFRLGPEHSGAYDLVLEHCCFCAIDPARRGEYALAVRRALLPGGRFVGLFWCHPYPGGPPFGASPEEVERCLGQHLALRHREVPQDSILTRTDQELLLDMEREDALQRG